MRTIREQLAIVRMNVGEKLFSRDGSGPHAETRHRRRSGGEREPVSDGVPFPGANRGGLFSHADALFPNLLCVPSRGQAYAGKQPS